MPKSFLETSKDLVAREAFERDGREEFLDPEKVSLATVMEETRW